MSEHIHRCLDCTPDMVPAFDQEDPRYHAGGKCVHPITKVMVNGVVVEGYTQGVFEGPEGWALFVGTNVHEVHPCACHNRETWQGMTCQEPLFGVVTVEHAPPVMVDILEVIHRVPQGWPGPEGTLEAQQTFDAGWESFWRWLHKQARTWE
jgi:hypothetical protein